MRVRFGHPVGGGVPPLALAAFAVIIRGIRWQMCKATRAGRQELQRTVNARVWSTCVSTCKMRRVWLCAFSAHSSGFAVTHIPIPF